MIVEEDQDPEIVEDHVIEAMIECEEDQEAEIVGVGVDRAIVDRDLAIGHDVIDHDPVIQNEDANLGITKVGVGEEIHPKDGSHVTHRSENENIVHLQVHHRVQVLVLPQVLG